MVKINPKYRVENTSLIISDFKNSHAALNGNRRIKISKTDLLWGLITTGKSHWRQYFQEPNILVYDFLNHFGGISPYFEFSPDISTNDRFEKLDMSDKGQKSYVVGMGIAKIIASRILKVPYLLHIDDLIKAGKVQLTTGTNERGDLAGIDKDRNWHVVEAKGRSGGVSRRDKVKAKKQVEKISTINGVPPLTKSYCISCIYNSFNQIFLVDPDEKSPNKVDIIVDDIEFIKFYYDKIFRSFYNIPQSARITFEEVDVNFTMFNIDSENNIYIGLEENIFKNLQGGITNIASFIFEQRFEQFEQFADFDLDNISIGLDGIVVFEDNQQLLNNVIDRTQIQSLKFQTMK